MAIHFTVIPYSERSRSYQKLKGYNEAFLVRDNWDDYDFKTTFSLVYFDLDGDRFDIGEVKVMKAGVAKGYTPIDRSFVALGQGYGSLGQGQEYYETLLELDEETRVAILVALRDVIWSEDVRSQLTDEPAYDVSLMRSVGEARFAKLVSTVHEYAAPTSFDFAYRFPDGGGRIRFSVAPNSVPPTNIHVLIGRNGVGKTRLLTALSSLLRNGRERRLGRLSFRGDDTVDAKDQFAGLVTVAFSAFDSFEPPRRSAGAASREVKAATSSGLEYTYVGLKKRVLKGGERTTANKSERDLQKDFVQSVLRCLRSASRPRWQSAIRLLEADPVFATLRVSDLGDTPADDLEARAGEIFSAASSGHKIVLLTLTRLAELVSERTLVLIDEPESHLHPPLVMVFVRALSELLSIRNGVAILATHSPVVVQEVPASCVTLLFRPGDVTTVERPEIETFAENVGTLTREIFRVQVTESGHHRLIATAVSGSENLEEVLSMFDNQLGADGRALARTMLREDR